MRRILWTLVSCLCLVPGGRAQQVTGSGTTNTISPIRGQPRRPFRSPPGRLDSREEHPLAHVPLAIYIISR
jgi:hypothetical protein